MFGCLDQHKPYELCLGCGPSAPIVADKPRGITHSGLDKTFIIFVESRGGVFWLNAKRRKRQLGYKTDQQLCGDLKALENAGWLDKIGSGKKRWNPDKVAPEWVAAFRRFEGTTSDPVPTVLPSARGDFMLHIACQVVLRVNPRLLREAQALSTEEILARLTDADLDKFERMFALILGDERARRRSQAGPQ